MKKRFLHTYVNKLSRGRLYEMGMLSGEWAFRGPRRLELHPTNICDNRCIACWKYSPLLGGKGATAEWMRQQLSLEEIEALADDLVLLGTPLVNVAGGGEPLMHPRIVEIFEMLRSKGLECSLCTNATKLTADIARKLVDLELDEIVVSLWAGTWETYRKLHLNAKREVFEAIKGILGDMISYRNSLGRRRPRVVVYCVISNINCREIREMATLTREVGADECRFSPVDMPTEEAKALALSPADITEIKRQFEDLRQDPLTTGLGEQLLGWNDAFMRRISSPGASRGVYEGRAVSGGKCYAGWWYSEVFADGSVHPCCKAEFIIPGNIREKPFREIWNSPPQREFRRKRNLEFENYTLPRGLNCALVCDNFYDNNEAAGLLTGLGAGEAALLTAMGKALGALGLARPGGECV